jgi:hypothetical protein
LGALLKQQEHKHASDTVATGLFFVFQLVFLVLPFIFVKLLWQQWQSQVGGRKVSSAVEVFPSIGGRGRCSPEARSEARRANTYCKRASDAQATILVRPRWHFALFLLW